MKPSGLKRPAQLPAVLLNRYGNYFLRFRFRLLKFKTYGSGSDFWKVIVPVQTFEKLRFRFQLNIWTIKSKFFTKIFEKNLAFLHSKFLYKEKNYKFHQIYWKMWIKKIEMKEIKYIILDLVLVLTFYSSASQKVTVPTVPVAQDWLPVPDRRGRRPSFSRQWWRREWWARFPGFLALPRLPYYLLV